MATRLEVIAGGSAGRPARAGKALDIVVLGLSLTSSWGNGHAAVLRGLVRELAARGHGVRFLERDLACYAAHRDIPENLLAHVDLYPGLGELRHRWTSSIRRADLVLMGSHVPQGAAVAEWLTANASGLTAFYDLDSSGTLTRLWRSDEQYISATALKRFGTYLSYTGGPAVDRLQREFGVHHPQTLYGAVDASQFYPEERDPTWDLGYYASYASDRHLGLERLLMDPARRWRQGRFVVAGGHYPTAVLWPPNVSRFEQVAPEEQRGFWSGQRFSLHLSRADAYSGFAPGPRLLEAAACGAAVLTDAWRGLDAFFKPGEEVLVVRSSEDVLGLLRHTPERERLLLASRARHRVLSRHTVAHRVAELEAWTYELLAGRAPAPARRPTAGSSLAGS